MGGDGGGSAGADPHAVGPSGGGAAVAEEVLAGVADPECLTEVDEWLVRCEIGDELLARATAARTGAGPDRH